MEREEIVKSDWIRSQFEMFFMAGVVFHDRVMKYPKGESPHSVFKEVFDLAYNGKNDLWKKEEENDG